MLLTVIQLISPRSGLSQATLPPGFSETRIRNISSPAALALAPDGRAFVCSQGGSVRVIKNEALLATPLITLSVSAFEERGLTGIQVDPNFASNGYIYLYYAALTPTIHNRLSRFTVVGDVANPNTEVILFDLPSLTASGWHNGGGIQFGPDGKLYLSVGENNVPANGQSLETTLGKILRINPDGTIPSDNPFFNATTGQNRAIWARGFRNPYTITFQPGTGRMFINDVGSYLWEEISEGVAGGNYGWPTYEGYTTAAGFQSPVHAYPHPEVYPTSSAITGGAFYNPDAVNFPAEYVGKYFFSDGFQQFIKVLDPVTRTVTPFASFPYSIYADPIDNNAVVALYPTVGKNGFLYYLARSPISAQYSSLNIIRYIGGSAPQIGSQPVNQLAAAGNSASFEVSAFGNAPLTYRWQRRNSGATSFADVPGGTANRLTLLNVSVADNGAQFRCIITNLVGSATSSVATLTVSATTPPTPTISAPVGGTKYRGGDIITFEGSGTDPVDGILSAARLSWKIDFHHLEHTHPVLPETSGIRSGSFEVPTLVEASPDVWFRIYLTATGSSGLSATTYREIFPLKSTNTLTTDPPGLQVLLDGHPAPTPTNWVGVINVIRSLGAASQSYNGNFYVFDSWSDNGAATHDIATPETATTYTARFRLVPPTDNAAMTSQTVPSQMITGLSYNLAIRMQNTGNTTWPANSTYVLAAQNPANNTVWRATPVTLPTSVAPGDSYTFTFSVKAPTTAGTYNLQWQMQKAGTFFGSPSDNATINVAVPTGAAANNAAFVSQGVPTTMAPGSFYNVLVTMRNTGAGPWSFDTKHKLGSANPRDNTRWGFTRINLTNATANIVNPGEIQTFNFRVKAPTTPGTYNFQWQMLQELVGWFGTASANQIINVTGSGTTPITFAMPPTNRTVNAGQSTSFFAGAIGSSPISFQWQRRAPGSADFTSIPGATSATLLLASVGGNDNGAAFRCVAVNPAGSVTSPVATLTVGGTGSESPPTVVVPPASQTVAVGSSATFGITVTGTAPLAYQWHRKEPAGATFNPIPGAINPTYQIASVTANDNGAQFQCVVSNTVGNDSSAPASLTVIGTGGGGAPTITSFSPANGLRQVPITTSIQVVFSKDMDPNTINASTFTLIRKTTTLVLPATITYNPGTRTATLTPSSPLKTDWTYNVTVIGGAAGVKDTGGQALASTATWSFYTTDTLGPRIFNVAVSAIGTTSATISWDTNENADSQVRYGPALPYSQATPVAGALVLRRSMTLTGLTRGTVYNYEIRSRDGYGNLSVRANATFTTAP